MKDLGLIVLVAVMFAAGACAACQLVVALTLGTIR